MTAWAARGANVDNIFAIPAVNSHGPREDDRVNRRIESDDVRTVTSIDNHGVEVTSRECADVQKGHPIDCCAIDPGGNRIATPIDTDRDFVVLEVTRKRQDVCDSVEHCCHVSCKHPAIFQCFAAGSPAWECHEATHMPTFVPTNATCQPVEVLNQ